MTSRDGTLWISTQDGNIIRMRDGKFESVRLPPGLVLDQKAKPSDESLLWERRIQQEQILEGSKGMEDESALYGRTHAVLIEDGEGAVWWHISPTAVVRLKGDSWSVFTPTNGLPAGGVRQLAVDHEGRVWAEADGKLHRYDGDGWDTHQEAVPLGGRWPVLASANEGGLWVAEPHGSWFHKGGEVRRFSSGQWHSGPKPILAVPTPGSIITCLMEDHSGHIWYGTASGVGVFFSDSDGNWHRLKAQNPFTQGYVSCLFEDSQGNIWIGSVGDGLYRVTRQPLTMLTLPPSSENAEINTLCVAHDGAIWIGTGGFGLLRFKDNNFTTFGDAQEHSNHVCAVFEDSQSNLWAGTSEGLFQLETNRFVRVIGPSEMTNWVKVLFEDRTGRLWIGAVGGLICREKNRFTVFHLRADRGYCDIRSIAEDPTGNLWIGTVGQGLFLLPHDQTEDLHHVEEYPATDARSLFCSKDGTLWIGSWGEGLIRYSNGVFTTFTTDNGLPSDRIQSIINDDENRLWLSTDNGVVGIATQLLQNYKHGYSPPLWCNHLSLAEGLANRGCSGSGQPVSTRTQNGWLLFPDHEGICMLNPNSITTKPQVPVVLAEAVQADGKTLTLTQSGEFQALSSTRRFEFDYAAPDLSLSQTLSFRYRLEGMDHDWVKTGAQNVANYSQLRPGHYKFDVMVSGSDGEWHKAEQEVNLYVVPQLWERRWIQILASGLFIGTMAGGITWGMRRKFQLRVERLEMQQAVEKERRRIARDLHDELGARLTATALQGELAVQDGTISEKAKSELNFMNQRVRQLIGTVDEVVWTTDPQNDTLPDLAAFLCDYIERLLAPTGIGCRLEVDSELPDLPLPALARRNMLLAFKEALNNSIRHAKARTIYFKIHLKNDLLHVEISDDGHGFEANNGRPGGKGLSNIKSRMELIRGQATIRSGADTGTTVSLLLPLPGINSAHHK